MVPDVSIVIVSYNTRDLLDRCLSSIYGSSCGLDLEIIVVDNGSRDGSAAMLRREYPSVRLIECGVNLGFARANNFGMSKAAGRYVLLLNSDTEITRRALDDLVQYADAMPRVAVLGPRLLNSDGTDQGVAKAFPTPMAALFGRKSIFTRLWPGNPFSKRYLVERYRQGDSPFSVDSVSGACMLVRREAIAEVGPFDEDFFMYWEDVDWCYRMKQAGWLIHSLPAVRVIHHEGQSAKRHASRMVIEFHRSVYRYYCKHHARSPLDPRRLVALFGLSLRASGFIAGRLARDLVAKARRRAPGSPARGPAQRALIPREALDDGA